MTPKAQATKAKIDKWDCIFKKLLHNKGNNLQRRHPTEWEKVFADYSSSSNSYPEYIRNSHRRKNKTKNLTGTEN